jgi:hypothetical protein
MFLWCWMLGIGREKVGKFAWSYPQQQQQADVFLNLFSKWWGLLKRDNKE